MGYAGGDKDNPTYHNLGNHTETFQVDFDPEKISYEELLTIFWSNHSPENRPFSRQYMSMIFYHNEEQKALAEQSKQELEAQTNNEFYTEIRPLDKFYLAENYHQKYYLQNRTKLLYEVQKYYSEFQEIIDSPTAAKLNGYIANFGDKDQLEKDLPNLGLSPKGEKRLNSLVD